MRLRPLVRESVQMAPSPPTASICTSGPARPSFSVNTRHLFAVVSHSARPLLVPTHSLPCRSRSSSQSSQPGSPSFLVHADNSLMATSRSSPVPMPLNHRIHSQPSPYVFTLLLVFRFLSGILIMRTSL